MAKSGQEVHRLPLGDENCRTIAKNNFPKTTLQILAPICCTICEKFTQERSKRMRESTQNKLFITADRIEGTGLELHAIHHLFFTLVFLVSQKNKAGPIQISSKSLKIAQLVRSQHCLVNCSQKSGKKVSSLSYSQKTQKKNAVRSKNTDFCMGHMQLANSLRI